MACFHLMEALGECLAYFNEQCSKNHLQTEGGDFTPATICKLSRKIFAQDLRKLFLSFLASASRAALADFRDEWNQENKGLDINECTAFGGCVQRSFLPFRNWPFYRFMRVCASNWVLRRESGRKSDWKFFLDHGICRIASNAFVVTASTVMELEFCWNMKAEPRWQVIHAFKKVPLMMNAKSASSRFWFSLWEFVPAFPFFFFSKFRDFLVRSRKKVGKWKKKEHQSELARKQWTFISLELCQLLSIPLFGCFVH